MTEFKSIKQITDEYRHQTYEQIEEQTRSFKHVVDEINNNRNDKK